MCLLAPKQFIKTRFGAYCRNMVMVLYLETAAGFAFFDCQIDRVLDKLCNFSLYPPTEAPFPRLTPSL
jgi:hypothetical protein